VTLDPTTLPQDTRERIQKALEPIFGTPAAPRCGDLDENSLARGSRIFKLQCTSCHGMAGDGRGPNSPWAYPPARDFRQGQFKFVSTADGLGWPTMDDLHRTIRRGLGSSIMPPFELLGGEDLDAVSHYVLHLMFRGMVEYDLLAAFGSDDPPDDVDSFAKRRFEKWFGQWKRSQSTAIEPQLAVALKDGGQDSNYDAAIRRGHGLFVSESVGCAKCHVDYGRSAAWRYDIWGAAVKPNNLTQGTYRGGNEPADLFKRIRTGMPAVGMPAASLNDEEIEDLVRFLKALPDPRHLPPDLRKTIYPELPP
jgi:mono/diheme cytochrome c family protein